MNFTIIHGTQETKPLELEYVGDMVFVRKNIKRITTQDSISGTSVEMWEYEEAYCSRIEFTEFIASKADNDVQDLDAKIDYIAMMTDVNLEV